MKSNLMFAVYFTPRLTSWSDAHKQNVRLAANSTTIHGQAMADHYAASEPHESPGDIILDYSCRRGTESDKSQQTTSGTG